MGRRALVIGGGGPSGPLVVDGLLARGFSVAVLNTGRHPAVFHGSVERIIADPHFSESLDAALRGRSFDVAVAQYGRLRLVAAALAGRCGQLVAVSTRAYPGWLDPFAMTRPGSAPEPDLLPHHDDAVPVPETTPLSPIGRFGARIVEADAAVRAGHDRGDYSATLLRYPRLYGPRQAGAPEWSIIRRLLDGRRRILVPEGGFLVRSLLYAGNAARIVLGCVDMPDRVAGEAINCADAEPLTLRRWIRILADACGREVELVSLPMALAKPAWGYARFPLTVGHQVMDTRKLEAVGIDLTPADVALRTTAAWYLADPARGAETARDLSDRFDYAQEDQVVAAMDMAARAIGASPVAAYAHPLAHPLAGVAGSRDKPIVGEPHGTAIGRGRDDA